jgi:hypothetical protein
VQQDAAHVYSLSTTNALTAGYTAGCLSWSHLQYFKMFVLFFWKHFLETNETVTTHLPHRAYKALATLKFGCGINKPGSM